MRARSCSAAARTSAHWWRPAINARTSAHGWPAATNARSVVLLRCLGLLAGVVAQAVEGRMPADQEPIRYTGFFGQDNSGKPFLSREVLGGGSGGRRYADGSDAIH